VREAGQIRCGKRGENGAGNGRKLRLRNDAIVERLSGKWVGDADAEGAEIALVHRGGRDSGELERVIDAAEALVIGEKEELVFPQRPAERAAELVLVKGQSAAADRLEEAGGVQLGIAQKLPQFSVELVGAALDGGVDDGTGCAAELGAVIVGLDFELLQRVG